MNLLGKLGFTTTAALLFVVTWAGSAAAQTQRVPEPGTATLLAAGAAAVALGARLFRRK